MTNRLTRNNKNKNRFRNTEKRRNRSRSRSRERPARTFEQINLNRLPTHQIEKEPAPKFISKLPNTFRFGQTMSGFGGGAGFSANLASALPGLGLQRSAKASPNLATLAAAAGPANSSNNNNNNKAKKR
jgi:hypothetical protein